MRNILIVDDEETLLLILKMESRLDEYKNQFNVITAQNGKEAVKILESNVIDFVVTDLKMPEMDGIELLAHMSAKFPSTPAIAMSAFSTPEIEKQLEKMGTLRVLDKPVDFKTLAHTIEELERSHEGGVLRGISACSFIQLIQMEEKTCLLEVHGEGQKRGFLYFSQGDLFDATCGDRQGEPAAFEIIGWDNVQLYLRDLPKKKAKKRIDKGIMFLIMEGLRLKDEAAKAKKSESLEPELVTEIPDTSLMDELEGILDQSDQDLKATSLGETHKSQEPRTKEVTPEVEFVRKIFRITNSKLRGSEFLQAVFREIHGVVPFDLAIIMSKDKSRPDHLTVVDLMASSTTTISKGACYPCQGSIIATVLKQQTPLIVDDTGSLSDAAERELFANHGPKACLLAPLMTDGVATGILALTTTKAGILYDVESLMEAITKGISLAIERNSMSAALIKRKLALDATKRIGHALATSTFDIDKVLKYSMYIIRRIMSVEAGSLFLTFKGELQVATAFNINSESVKKSRLEIGQGLAGHVAAKGESIIVNDMQKSSHFLPGIDKQTGFKTRSALCVPMISQEKVIGVIEVLNKTNGDFDTSDEDLLQSIADSVSVAIKSAGLYKKVFQMAKREREARFKLQEYVSKGRQAHGENARPKDVALISRKDSSPFA